MLSELFFTAIFHKLSIGSFQTTRLGYHLMLSLILLLLYTWKVFGFGVYLDREILLLLLISLMVLWLLYFKRGFIHMLIILIIGRSLVVVLIMMRHILELNVDMSIYKVWFGQVKLLNDIAFIGTRGVFTELVVRVTLLEIFLTWKTSLSLERVIVHKTLIILVLHLFVIVLLIIHLLIIWILKLCFIIEEVGLLHLVMAIMLYSGSTEHNIFFIKCESILLLLEWKLNHVAILVVAVRVLGIEGVVDYWVIINMRYGLIFLNNFFKLIWVYLGTSFGRT